MRSVLAIAPTDFGRVWRFLPDLQAIVAGSAAGFFLQRWFLPRYRSLLIPVLGFIGLGALLNIRLLFGAVPAQWEIGVRGEIDSASCMRGRRRRCRPGRGK